MMGNGLKIQRENTLHGPEIVAVADVPMFAGSHPRELARWTVGEFEALLYQWQILARTARADLTKKSHLKNLPMR